jgi:hypothetical protein
MVKVLQERYKYSLHCGVGNPCDGGKRDVCLKVGFRFDKGQSEHACPQRGGPRSYRAYLRNWGVQAQGTCQLHKSLRSPIFLAISLFLLNSPVHLKQLKLKTFTKWSTH